MLRIFSKVVTLIILLCSFSLDFASDWPQFRGPNCSGVSAEAKPPIKIEPKSGALWKAEVPWSPSSPCVSGDKIFLTTWSSGQLETRCYAANSGRSLWTRGIKPEKVELFH